MGRRRSRPSPRTAGLFWAARSQPKPSSPKNAGATRGLRDNEDRCDKASYQPLLNMSSAKDGSQSRLVALLACSAPSTTFRRTSRSVAEPGMAHKHDALRWLHGGATVLLLVIGSLCFVRSEVPMNLAARSNPRCFATYAGTEGLRLFQNNRPITVGPEDAGEKAGAPCLC